MSAPKLRRWTCPRCSTGRLAPSRPRRDDVRRYCLPCSEATGRLVERVCPANERERATSTAASTTKRKAKASTAATRRAEAKAAEKARLDKRFTRRRPYDETVVDLRRELPRVWRAARKVEPRLSPEPPKLVASHGSGSYACKREDEIRLGRGCDWHTLVHEVAHFVQFRRGFAERSDGKRAVHDRAFYFILRDVMERLVPGLRVSFVEVSSWGYVVDGIIARQVSALGRDRNQEAS